MSSIRISCSRWNSQIEPRRTKFLQISPNLVYPTRTENSVAQLREMGGTTSKIYGKLSRSWTSASCSSENFENTSDLCRSPSSVGPFVFTRRGSQFFDEDGDLAHEFYEEQPVDDPYDVDDELDSDSNAPSTTPRGGGGGKRTRRLKMRLKRKFRNLSPEGMVKLQYPRLHGDLPVILCHVPPSQWTTLVPLYSPAILIRSRPTTTTERLQTPYSPARNFDTFNQILPILVKLI